MTDNYQDPENIDEIIEELKRSKTIENVVEVSDQMHLKALSKTIIKYFICYPKAVD